jgi:hypothetical protein
MKNLLLARASLDKRCYIHQAYQKNKMGKQNRERIIA